MTKASRLTTTASNYLSTAVDSSIDFVNQKVYGTRFGKEIVDNVDLAGSIIGSYLFWNVPQYQNLQYSSELMEAAIPLGFSSVLFGPLLERGKYDAAANRFSRNFSAGLGIAFLSSPKTGNFGVDLVGDMMGFGFLGASAICDYIRRVDSPLVEYQHNFKKE